MNGRTLAIQQCAEPRDISPTHRRYREGLRDYSMLALLTAGGGIAEGFVWEAVRFAHRLIALRKRANRRRMAQGLAPWCVLCGADAHFDSDDQTRHMAGDDRSHKARV